MKLPSKTYRRTDWYITSKFGYRIHPITGKKTFHNGIDVGTNCQKWAIYALEDGYVHVVSRSKTGYGNSIWVRYPRINRSLLYAHMDSIKVTKGQKVKAGTLLGYTGTTGSSTGIHLHLGMTKIGSDVWLDPYAYDYEEPSVKYNLTRTLRKGYKGNDVKKLQTDLMALGYSVGRWGAGGTFGEDTKNAVKKFQKAKKLTADGIVGKNTAHALGWLYNGK